MTSPTLLALLRHSVGDRFPTVDTANASKSEILSRVADEFGWESIPILGSAVEQRAHHPVVAALIRSPEPHRLMSRWLTLERFGHTKNRCELRSVSSDRLVVAHYSLDGGDIQNVDDLYIWGLLCKLLEMSGVAGLSAWLHGEVQCYPNCSGPEPSETDEVEIRWSGLRTAEWSPPPEDAHVVSKVRDVLNADLLHGWTLAAVAKHLGMSQRNLQRRLAEESTSFSQIIQKTRVDESERLLRKTELSVAEIAFCTGFSDHAHFTRTFRKHLDVPPTTYRTLVD